MSIDTVIFDLDGVIIETEQLWNRVRSDFAVAHGGHWSEHDQRGVMGANSMEWAVSMRENNGVRAYRPGDLRRHHRRPYGKSMLASLPLIPGAVEAVFRLAAGLPAGGGLVIAP